jgi:hypothetical protein
VGEVAVVNTGTWTRANGTTMALADATMTFFSAAAQPLTPVTDTAEEFDRASKRYQLVSAGGTINLQLRKPKGAVDPRVGEIGILSSFEFDGKAVGMLSPIVLDLDGDGVELVKRKKAKARFDMNGDGRADDTGWVGKSDGMLVIDRNNDGRITSNSELTFGAEDGNASSSLEALMKLDSNNDRKIDAADARFGELKVWIDRNGNGVTDSGELKSLADLGIASISLSSIGTEATAKPGKNIVRSTASFTRADGSIGTVGDVALAFRPAAEAGLDQGLESILDRLRNSNLFDGDADLSDLFGPRRAVPSPVDRVENGADEGEGRAGPRLPRSHSIEALGADAELGRRLAAIAQDLASFGGASAAALELRQSIRDGTTDLFAG